MNTCPYCKHAGTTELTDTVEIIFKGRNVDINIEYSSCPNCDREFISKDQILRNDAIIVREE